MYKRIVKQYLGKYLPKKIYDLGRSMEAYKNQLNKEKIPKMSESKFKEILTDILGIKRGAVVFVHSSVDNLNPDFPFYRILFHLQELVGEEGTLLFPCSQLSERAEDYLKRGEIFDVKKSPTTNGIIPELARHQKRAFRSLHPTNSVVALGRHAEELTRTHADSIYPCGEQSPYYKIVDYNGIIIGLGVNTDNLTFGHCVEDILREKFPVQTRGHEIFKAKVRDLHGQIKIVPTLAAHKRIQWRNPGNYIKQYVSPDVCQNLTINGIKFFRADAKNLYNKMVELAKKDITVYSKFVYKKHFISKYLCI